MNYIIPQIKHKSKLLLRKVLRLVKFSPSFVAYKDEDSWFVQDLNGFSKQDNELVLGVPEFLERFLPESKKIKIYYYTTPQTGSIELTMISTSFFGTTYSYTYKGSKYSLWLCPVLFWYFPEAPKRLFVKMRRIA